MTPDVPISAGAGATSTGAPLTGPLPRRLLFAREPGWQFSLMLALEVVFLFVAVPALSAGDASRRSVVFVQFTLVAVAIALIAKSAWLRLCLAVSFGLPVFARLYPDLVPQTLTLGMVFAYNLLVTAAMARAVFGPGDVNHHRLAGAVFIYLNVALLFVLAYDGLMLLIPDAITGIVAGRGNRASEMIHFSFTTLTAIGDSNVVLRSPFARSLADLETIIGQLFPAILLSRLVGLHLNRQR